MRTASEPIAMADAVPSAGPAAATRGAVRVPYGHAIPFILLLAFLLWRCWVHEPWFDELHAYLIAREAHGLGDLIANLRNDGHPGLWHLLLFGITRIVPSPDALAIAQSMVVTAMLALIWFASPFNVTERLLISLSYYVAWEYGVMARSYGLGVVFLWAAVAWRGHWIFWICLGLAANISAHFMLAAGAFGAWRFFQAPRPTLAMVGCLALVAIAIATAWPAPDTIGPANPLAEWPIRVLRPVFRLSAALLPMTIADAQYKYWDAVFSDAGVIVAILIGISVFYIGIISLRGKIALQLVFTVVAGGLLLLSTAIYPASNRHYGIIYVVIVACHWIAREEGAAPSTTFRLWLALCALAGIWTTYWSFGAPFSSGRMVAEWIAREVRPGQAIASFPTAHSSDMAAYLRTPSFNLESGRAEMFVRFTYAGPRMPVTAPEFAALLSKVPGAGDFILILGSEQGGSRLATGAQDVMRRGLTAYGFDAEHLRHFPAGVFAYDAYLVRRASP